MTKKDYVKIAAALKCTRGISSAANMPGFVIVDDAMTRIAEVLAADDPKFDRARFYAACGVEDAR